MPKIGQRVHDHRDKPSVRRTDLLASPRVQLTRGDRDHGPVPPVPDQLELLADIGLDLRVRPARRGHRRLDLRRPHGDVDLAQLLDHGGP
ncbi:hypothetical protein SHKM778_20850 [Streptomyces sp. KM77-8]|uniref:Uncharacterized protein n=1 Tax=Streptomyces haneummycinicus TaxID=3074435 RepID=A0AAT9HEF8_9ACTN